MSITDCDTVYGPGAGHLDEPGIGGNPYPYGECTWLVWQFYHDTQNIDIVGNMGNATDWTRSAQREGYDVDMTPAVGKAVSWSATKYPEFGHVAVVIALTQAGFRVVEMNFKWFASEDPTLAGKIDCREVTSLDGITGFITPHGVQTGGGGQANDLLAALAPGLGGIASAISQAALYAQAQIMTAELRATSYAQVAAGMLVAGGGGALAAFTLAGHGDPAAGARTVGRRLPAMRQQVEQEVVGDPGPPEPNWTQAERAWTVARQARQARQIAQRPR